MKKIFLTLVTLVSFAVASKAQSNTVNHLVTVTINEILNVRFNPTATSNTTFTFDTGNKLDSGIVNTSAASLQVRANKNWKVNVKAQNADFATTSTVSTAMPCGILAVKKSSGTYVTLTTADQEISSGNKGGWGSTGFALDYKANPGFGYDPATYTLPVVYTVTAQ